MKWDFNKPYIIAQHKNASRITQRAVLPAVLAGFLAAPGLVLAQTDTFDNYTSSADFMAGGWVISQLAPGYVTTTLPAYGSGKALRIRSNPIPGQAPAVAISYRTTEYSDFYLAADFVGWSHTNQSFALLARGAIGDDPSSATGYMVNYNVAQQGDGPTNAQQGELEISVLAPDFSATQLASAEVTLVEGGAYRIVFTGIGYQFTASVYDLSDLTTPLIQIVAVDSGANYTSGVCGIMTFSRDDLVGSADVTVDNYQIAGSDPNPATAPALAHPVVGMPTIETRIPAERFCNFYSPTGGISFTVRTYTTNVIDSAATKVRLNGVDVSGQLVLSPKGSSVGGVLPPAALATNTVYRAQIEAQDVSGRNKSTNTFWFDTFSEAYLASPGVKVIEAEDYNYSNGLYNLDPIPISGLDTNGDPVAASGVGYFNRHGIEGVDFHDASSIPAPLWAGEYRMFDPIGLCEGMFPEVQDANDPYGERRYSDYVRTQYLALNMLELVVHRTAPGEWLNYTRNFQPGNYYAWLRVASLGATEVDLSKVTSDPRAPNQTTTNLGKFSVPNQFTRYNFSYVPLLDSSNSPAVVGLSGLTTLQLTMAGTPGQDSDKAAINYILFTPAPMAIRVLSSSTVTGLYTEESGATVDFANRKIQVPAPSATRFYRLDGPTALTAHGITVSDGTAIIQY